MEGPQDFEGAINAATEAAAKLRAERFAIKERGQALQDIANKVDSADAIAVRAAVLHDKINAFVALAELLRPDALPAQMVADAPARSTPQWPPTPSQLAPRAAHRGRHGNHRQRPALRAAVRRRTGHGRRHPLRNHRQARRDRRNDDRPLRHAVAAGAQCVPDMARRPRRSWRHRNRRCLCDAQSEPTTLPKDVFQVEWLSGATEEMEEAA